MRTFPRGQSCILILNIPPTVPDIAVRSGIVRGLSTFLDTDAPVVAGGAVGVDEAECGVVVGADGGEGGSVGGTGEGEGVVVRGEVGVVR